MLTAFSSIGKIVKPRIGHVSVDNTLFRFHYSLTFAILLVCCISVTLTQFIGDPIFCISNALGPKAKAEMKAVNIYCLISSTFTLPDEYDKETGADVAHPGLGVDAPEKDKRYHSYYIWVPIVLLLQAISFRIPHLLWKGFEGGRLRAIIVESSTVVLGLDKRQEVESRVLDYLETFKGRHNLWFFKYVLCEFLNFVVVVGNIYATDAFLGHEFSKYGLEVVQFLDEDPRSRTDPMVRVFPRVTKCTFHKQGPSGTISKADYICILAMNIINEKIYVFLWFWFIILATLTIIGLFYRLATILIPRLREWILISKGQIPRNIKETEGAIEEEKKKKGFSLGSLYRRSTNKQELDAAKTIVSRVGLGDWFLIHHLGNHMDPLLYGTFLLKYSKTFYSSV